MQGMGGQTLFINHLCACTVGNQHNRQSILASYLEVVEDNLQ